MRHRLFCTAWAAALSLSLAACGGGGSDDAGGGATPQPTPQPQPQPQPTPLVLQPACSGAFCAAVGSRYSGSGVGLWSYTNYSAQSVSLPLALSQLPPRPLLLVYSNGGAASVALPALRLQASSARAQERAPAPDAGAAGNQIPAMIRDFRLGADSGASPQVRAAQSTPARAALAALGTVRSWYVSPSDGSFQSRSTSLQRQRVAADGRVINLWLQTGEAGSNKVTPAMLDTLMDRFARAQDGAYSMVTQIAGQPWGASSRSDVIGPDQPIDIVLANLTPDGKPYGLMGYFWALNNLLAKPGDAQQQYSNQSLSFYIDTETLYLDKNGLDAQVSTLAHELVHMVNFYQRDVRLGSSYSFATFLDETTALMMEDLLSDKLIPGANPARDSLVPRWLQQAAYNCDLVRWDTGNSCFSYNVNGSYGAYLLRQYGTGFFQQLLKSTSSTDSVALLDNAITQAGGPGLAGTLARWGAGIALLPAAASPAGYGFPARADASGHLLPAIDGAALAAKRQLPSQVPSTLVGHGLFPFTRQPDAQGNYQEQLSVPPGVTLTVVAQ